MGPRATTVESPEGVPLMLPVGPGLQWASLRTRGRRRKIADVQNGLREVRSFV